eukprot:TRINITY_DN5688_c0_g1_i1.p1 TRINITY_DN5688_c0_g1~~TRINITY_DN5688_c0_g1_i1.p1  ORF type:complete len:453 (-),score=129.03 TRINITY_DN5688_c0_g1_i1:165-1523(-)
MKLYSSYTALGLLLVALGCAQAFTVEDLPETPEDGELWVLLVAGSNGWFNYRHQADVCHAYQIVAAHGVPDDHIIVMMYDDIAYNIENPTPGKIINHPNGTDVYHGVPKDYVCGSVRPDIFLQVLKGEKVDGAFGSGKTLNSGANDNIFVYFADHGAKGLVAFGENTLKAVELNTAIKEMHAAKKYNKMVFYVEACESGSMFKGLLPADVNVFATTASNATTSSYACYFDKARKTFLGDVYSIKWLEDSDKENIEKETLEQQYTVVKKETNTSMVCQFGDMDISKMPVGTFQGPKPTIGLPRPTHPPHYPPSWFSCGADAVPGPEVPVKILQNNIVNAANAEDAKEAREKYAELMKNRKYMEGVVHDLIDVITNDVGLTNTIFTDNVELTQFDCYYAAVDKFHDKCFNVGKNDYGLRMLNTFVNLCERNFDINDITDAIQAVCTHPHMYGIH